MERSLVTDVQPSDAARAAVRELYESHAGDIHRYASRRVGSGLADDLVADTFRAALESFGRFDAARGSQRAWLFGIATNLLRKHRRSEFRRLAASARHANRLSPYVDSIAERTAAVDAEAELQRVLAAIEQLSDDDFDLLILVAWEALSSSDIAAILHIPRGTVRSRLHRIRTELDHARSTTTTDRRTP